MDELEDKDSEDGIWLDINDGVWLQFEKTSFRWGGELFLLHEFEKAIGLPEITSAALCDSHADEGTTQQFEELFQGSIYGRLADYDEVGENDSDSQDFAARVEQFETGTLTSLENRKALADLNGQWIDRFHELNATEMTTIVFDMGSLASPAHGDQEGATWNEVHRDVRYHSFFIFNHLGMLERAALRNGDAHSADAWQEVVDPVIARYQKHDVERYVRADAAFAAPAFFERLEDAGYLYVVQLPADSALDEKIVSRPPAPVTKPSKTKQKPVCEEFMYQDASWDKPRRIIARVKWRSDDLLFPRADFIVTNMTLEPDHVSEFYDKHRTVDNYCKKMKIKPSLDLTQLSCKRFHENEVRLQLHALAYNLATFKYCNGRLIMITGPNSG